MRNKQNYESDINFPEDYTVEDAKYTWKRDQADKQNKYRVDEAYEAWIANVGGE